MSISQEAARKLVELAAQNPNIPIHLLVSEDCVCPDYEYTVGYICDARIDEVCTLTPDSERMYLRSEEDELHDELADMPDNWEKSVKEIDAIINSLPWRKAIIVEASS